MHRFLALCVMIGCSEYEVTKLQCADDNAFTAEIIDTTLSETQRLPENDWVELAFTFRFQSASGAVAAGCLSLALSDAETGVRFAPGVDFYFQPEELSDGMISLELDFTGQTALEQKVQLWLYIPGQEQVITRLDVTDPSMILGTYWFYPYNAR